MQQLWTALAAFWGAGATLDDGCQWDPNGRCATGNAVPQSVITLDSGCKWDPDGRRCLPESAVPQPIITPGSGCSMDPNGGCLPGS